MRQCQPRGKSQTIQSTQNTAATFQVFINISFVNVLTENLLAGGFSYGNKGAKLKLGLVWPHNLHETSTSSHTAQSRTALAPLSCTTRRSHPEPVLASQVRYYTHNAYDVPTI